MLEIGRNAECKMQNAGCRMKAQRRHLSLYSFCTLHFAFCISPEQQSKILRHDGGPSQSLANVRRGGGDQALSKSAVFNQLPDCGGETRRIGRRDEQAGLIV